MIPRAGTTKELRPGMYLQASDGGAWKVEAVTLENFVLVNRAGRQLSRPRPFDAQPVTILEPDHDEAVAAAVAGLGGEVVAEKVEGEPFRIIGLGNQIAGWHTHMHLFHGIHTRTGPGSRSIEKVREWHALDHDDAAAGTPTGVFVKHRH